MMNTLNGATLGGAPPLAEFIVLAGRHGFGGIEFGIEEAVNLGNETSLDNVKALFDNAKVAPTTFGLPVDWRKGDREFREGIARLPEYAAAAQSIGCARTCTWLPPAVDSDPLTFRNEIRDRFREIAAVLGDYGIRFGLEWVGPRTLRVGPGAMGRHEFIYTMPAALELIADIDAPLANVGLLADAFHWFTTGASTEDVAALRPEQIVHVHINDAPDRPRDEQLDFDRLLPGDGVIDLHGYLSALKQIGYDGPVATETFNKPLAALGKEEAARLTAEAVQRVMAGL